MRTYRIETGHRIAPFGDPVGETFLLHATLAEAQDAAVAGCRGAGLEPEIRPAEPGASIAGPALVFRDDTWFTAATLAAFLAAPGPATGQLAARDGRFLADNRPLQELAHVTRDGVRHDLFPVWRIGAGERLVLPTRSREATAGAPVAIDLAEKRVTVPVPAQYAGADHVEIGLTARGILCVRHWVHVLRVNHAASGARWQGTPRWRSVLAVLWAILRALSWNKWKVLAKLGRRGPGCDIHPTAVVEGSTLGRGCVVGPGARVRFSDLGDGVTVQGGAEVVLSVLGAGSLVSQNCAVHLSVLYPGAAAAQYLLQSCLLGRDAVTTGGAFSLDLSFDREIRVEQDGRFVSAGTRFLGSCLGHRVRLGTGFYLNAGRAIPNDYVIIRDPDAILSRIPKDLPPGVPLRVRGRTLLPPDRPPQTPPPKDPPRGPGPSGSPDDSADAARDGPGARGSGARPNG